MGMIPGKGREFIRTLGLPPSFLFLGKTQHLLIVVAQNTDRSLPLQPTYDLVGERYVPQEIPQIPNLVHTPGLRMGQHGLQGR